MKAETITKLQQEYTGLHDAARGHLTGMERQRCEEIRRLLAWEGVKVGEGMAVTPSPKS